MKVLVLSPTKTTSGNLSTAMRLSSHLRICGHDVQTDAISSSLINLKASCYDVIFTIHAYKSAGIVSALPDSSRLVVIFGGTDLNHDSDYKDRVETMGKLLYRADHCIAISQPLRKLACSLWPGLTARISVIHQGVSTNPNPEFNLLYFLKTHCGLVTENVILLVAGIRPVKDLNFLLNEFADSSLPNKFSFVILGPKIDQEYGEKFMEEVKALRDRNVVYAGELSLADTHAAIEQSSFLVNSSKSEGMSGAILEAFDLGTLVIARDIPGNANLIHHNLNGFLYKTPQEFVRIVQKTTDSAIILEQIIGNAKDKLLTSFSLKREQQMYGDIISRLTAL